jgi:phospholipid/cholesterol/gamma-HCH transport system ATP-binding protein
MISIQSISKYFSNKCVLKDISLEVAQGEKIVVIGNSGCGKSTLLRLLLGLQKPDSGQIYIQGKNIIQMKDKMLQKMRLNMGMLFQSSALFDSMTVAENIAFNLVANYDYSFYEAKKKVKEVLSLVEMNDYEDVMPSNLSGGQKKRIGLARAIITNPKILLYDEPTTGLDPVLSTNIEDLIVKLNCTLNITSIIVSHQRSTILRTADKIYMLEQGRLLDAETPETIICTENKIINNFINAGA